MKKIFRTTKSFAPNFVKVACHGQTERTIRIDRQSAISFILLVFLSFFLLIHRKVGEKVDEGKQTSFTNVKPDCFQNVAQGSQLEDVMT